MHNNLYKVLAVWEAHHNTQAQMLWQKLNMQEDTSLGDTAQEEPNSHCNASNHFSFARVTMTSPPAGTVLWNNPLSKVFLSNAKDALS